MKTGAIALSGSWPFSSATAAFAAIPQTSASVPTRPMRQPESKNSQGELVGFDIDLAKELCKRINTQCTFVENPLDALIPSLKAKKIDAIMSRFPHYGKRQQEIAFTDNCTLPILVWWWRKFRHSADSRVAERQAGRRIAGHHP